MVTYDTPEIASQKVEYIKRMRLGGAMWWESSGDFAVDDNRSLINLVTQGLGGFEARMIEKSSNCLEYPQSKYDNLRKGMPNEP